MALELAALMALATAALTDAVEQTGLSDQALWHRVVQGADPLAGMSLDEAVRTDPRRVDAKIRQLYYQAMHRQFPSDPMSARLDEGLYLVSLRAVRQAGDGAVFTMPLISVHEENWYTVLGGTARTWPAFVRRALLSDWPAISSAFGRAQSVARQAELSAGRQGLHEDALEWRAFRDVLGQMRDGLHEVLRTGVFPEIPPPVRARIAQRRLLEG